jgi:hypothetical protein
MYRYITLLLLCIGVKLDLSRAWSLSTHSKLKNFEKQGSEAEIWTQEGEGNRELEKIA